jgi:hypothetical protein
MCVHSLKKVILFFITSGATKTITHVQVVAHNCIRDCSCSGSGQLKPAAVNPTQIFVYRTLAQVRTAGDLALF